MTDETFGALLRRHRKLLDLTQAELAHRVGCAAESVRKMEANRQRPSIHLARRLAELLELSPDQRLIFIQLARGWPVTRSAELR